MMGSYYTNLIAKGAVGKDVREALRGRDAYVAISAVSGSAGQDADVQIIFDGECDEGFNAAVSELASALSERLRCPVIGFAVFDDDALWYCLSLDGQIVDEYCSMPSALMEGGGSDMPEGGNARLLCAAFGQEAQAVLQVEKVLRASSLDGFALATQRYAALCGTLNLSADGAGLGFNYIEAGDFEPRRLQNRLVRV